MYKCLACSLFSRKAPGLWALLEGEFFTMVLKSSNIRNLEDPRPIVEIWDKVMKAEYHFTGDKIRDSRRQWFVPDTQISNG